MRIIVTLRCGKVLVENIWVSKDEGGGQDPGSSQWKTLVAAIRTSQTGSQAKEQISQLRDVITPFPFIN